MVLNISKEQFEVAVPVATSASSAVYDMVSREFPIVKDTLATEILGTAGVSAVENAAENDLVRSLYEWFVSVCAFLRIMRNLDLVLTPTGFGVVSSNDTVPASKQRVDALESHLRVRQLDLKDKIIRQMFHVEGWAAQPQRVKQVPRLFFSFQYLTDYAGMMNPKADDWASAQPAIIEAEEFLRKKISNEFVNELIMKRCSASVPVEVVPVHELYCSYVGACITGNEHVKDMFYNRLMNQLENNLDKYPAYANSQAYKVNHAEPYRNTAESTAFHFIG